MFTLALLATAGRTAAFSQAVPSDCWNQGWTWEHCCVPWSDKDKGIGNVGCWTHGFTYERCCEPTPGKPREFFACGGRGELWERFRRDMMLGRDWSSTQAALVVQRHISECLLGAVLAALVHLAVVVVARERLGGDASEAWAVADQYLRVLLMSPVSIEEIVASGWPMGHVFAMLRMMPWIEDKAARLAEACGGPPEESGEALRLASTVARALGLEQRVPMDAGIRFLAGSAADGDGGATLAGGSTEGPSGSGSGFATATALWAAAYTIGVVDAAQAPRAERPRMVAEAVRLLWLGESHFRAAALRGTAGCPGGGDAESLGVLAALLVTQQPLLLLLIALQWKGVVSTRPLSLLEETLHFIGLPSAEAAGLPAEVQPLDLYVLPMTDSVSNQVRASAQPFCYERTFLRIVAAVARAWAARKEAGVGVAAPAPRTMTLWEVGANLGDCSLWAASLLAAASGAAGDPPLRAELFEPISRTARSLRLSVEAFRERHGATVPLRVRQMALGSQAGRQEVGVPRGSLAEATFHGCAARYGGDAQPTGTLGCLYEQVRVEAADRLLRRGAAPEHRASRRQSSVDFMKVHVQGNELSVLRGAAQSLAAGRICLVLLKLSSIGFCSEDAASIGAELASLLSGFALALGLPNGTDVLLRPGAHGAAGAALLARLVNGTRRPLPPDWRLWDERGRGRANPYDGELVAWRSSGACRRSPAARAASSLFT